MVQYPIFGENLVAVVILNDPYDSIKETFVICRCTIKCWYCNTDLIHNLKGSDLILLSILEFGSLICALLINLDLSAVAESLSG